MFPRQGCVIETLCGLLALTVALNNSCTRSHQTKITFCDTTFKHSRNGAFFQSRTTYRALECRLSLVATTARLLRLGANFLLLDIVDKDLVALLHMHTSLAPVVATSIRKQVPLRIEGCTGNCSFNSSKSFETLLVVLVPKINHAIRADCRKRGKLILKGNGIDRIYIAVLSMAFKGKALFSRHFLEVMNANPSLNTPNSETSGIRKAGYTTTLKF
jgi:hypothetical protein